ncbi:hypothetical protein HRbin01_01515 [archaeon HR01]|nr:hypothetical protein HRbin01_01515 [archaeon HR01]
MRFNNIELEKVENFIREVRADSGKAVKLNEIRGRWLLDDVEKQFEAVAKTEKGEFRMEADNPSFMGGGGNRPGPMLYCLMGIASCFMATFVAVATEKRIPLKKAEIAASCELDMARVAGLSDNPPIRRITLELSVDSERPGEDLEQVLNEAANRCPAIYTLRTPLEPIIRLASP